MNGTYLRNSNCFVGVFVCYRRKSNFIMEERKNDTKHKFI